MSWRCNKRLNCFALQLLESQADTKHKDVSGTTELADVSRGSGTAARADNVRQALQVQRGQQGESPPEDSANTGSNIRGMGPAHLAQAWFNCLRGASIVVIPGP